MVVPIVQTHFGQPGKREDLHGTDTHVEAGMERNIMGELEACREAGTKPNFSDIARRYGVHRHTVAKYWREGADLEDRRSDRQSAFERVRDVVEERATLPGVTKRGIYEWLLDRYPGLGLPGYGAFTAWCRREGIALGPASAREPHPRFETAPGQQLQFDWKEDLLMHDRDGRECAFNVFTATLGYSRFHVFLYARTRTLDDLLACLVRTFVTIGGVPEECLTDNMSAVVSIRDGRRSKSERAVRFARDAGFRLELCKPRTPQTKGKDESANRFLSRLASYEGDFAGEGELAAIIARLQAESNREPNGTTHLPPATLFLREKDALRPVGSLRLLEEAVGATSVQVVPSTMLVRAAGREFSVPMRCIGRKVTVVTMPGGQVRVMMGGEEVACHDASSERAPFNYDESHYEEAIEGKRRYSDSDIREAARANLDLIDRMGRSE